MKLVGHACGGLTNRQISINNESTGVLLSIKLPLDKLKIFTVVYDMAQ